MTTQRTRPARPTRRALALTALLIVALVVLVAGPVSSAAAANKAWTIMLYLDADNSLEQYGPTDFVNELCNPGSTSNVNVVVLFDRIPKLDKTYGDWTSTKLFYCTAGLTPTPENAIADWGERNMGDPQTMIDFVSYCKTNYPADHYVIGWWDHGYCWWPNGWILSDDTSVDTLDLDEQAAGFDAVGGVDLIVSDQCQMQLLEDASFWQPYAKAVVASEEYVMWDGIDYGALTTTLQNNPDISIDALAADTVQHTQGDGLTYSAVALDSRFDALVTAVDEWALALRNGLPAYRSAYVTARGNTLVFDDPDEMDLYDAAFQIKAAVNDATIDAKCDAVMAAVNNVVLSNWISGSKYANAHGIAIWWPDDSAGLLYRTPYAPEFDCWAYYRTVVPSSLSTAWDSFLGAFALQDYVAPTTTDNNDGLPHQAFTLVLTPTDAASGVFYTEYRIDGGDWQTGTSAVMRIRIKHKRPGYSRGYHLVEYRSIDNAGNVEATKSCTVRLGV